MLALLALSFGAAIAVALVQRASSDVARTRALVAWEQTYLDALTLEKWACRHVLASELAPGGADRGLATPYTLTDAQGRLNLNNLVSAGRISSAHYLRLVRLLAVLGLPPELAAAVADWVDADDEVTWPGGAEVERYRALRPARRPANRPFGVLGELQDVYGLDDETFHRLMPHVTVLPGLTKVNVNSATSEVLQALIPGLTKQGAAALVARRQTRPFLTLQDFLAAPPIRALDVDHSAVTVSSEYFELQTRIAHADAAIVLHSLVHTVGQDRIASVVRRYVSYL